jgi:two-component system, chemotaxis family, chemotaxis protein CheY
MRALVVDDSRAMRLVLGQLLRQAGFEVTDAGNGVEGLERLGQMGRPDVVLVDWNMPDMDGLGFVRAVRAEAAYAGLPLVLVTAEDDAGRVADARAAGADDHLAKPPTPEALRATLRRLALVAE